MGDYDPIEHGPTIDYLRDFDFAPSQSDDLLEKIMEIHRTTLKGQSPAEAGQFPDQKSWRVVGPEVNPINWQKYLPLCHCWA